MTDRFSFLRRGNAEKLPIQSVFTHDLPDIKGEVALQYWPRRDGSDLVPSQTTLFILGNPGLLNYYVPFLNSLHALLPPSHAILSTSHIGHTPGLSAPSEPLSLSHQLEAKLELVQSLRDSLDTWSAEAQQGERPRLSLMGHSVGSWFVCELFKHFKQDIHAGYMLFPTVGWIADSWNGRMLWPIFRRPVRSLLSSISPLLCPILPYTSFPPTTLSLLRSPATISHALGLARSELDLIKDPDLGWFRSQADLGPTEGLFGVWSAGNMDGWVGREGPIVQDCLGGESSERVEILEGIPHAFCLSQEHSDIVAKVVAGWITGSHIDHPLPREPPQPFETTVPM
ncbi:hypothetical protein DB88DRAFT_489275 [Papiliotrema laurentii]|uniref:Lipid droplet-associated hydrolase n=1 Tax=Papiliotrema laurentii TaxID=5418 RepID=A0AAD9FLX3_PAPLA|nr:hypothetical protein DB88DRAFT_489275 [Papiliotrema laurentii]